MSDTNSHRHWLFEVNHIYYPCCSIKWKVLCCDPDAKIETKALRRANHFDIQAHSSSIKEINGLLVHNEIQVFQEDLLGKNQLKLF